MIHFEHTAAAFTLWLGVAHQAHPEPFADFAREAATLGPVSRTLIGHVMTSQRAVAVARPSWSPDNPHSLYLAFERHRQVLYGTQTPTAALSLCPNALAGEASALHNFAERYASRHPRLGWKFSVARLTAWQTFGFIPASEIVRRVEHGAHHLSESTRKLMLEAGFFGQRFEHFFDGTIPPYADGRVSVLHAIYHAMAITMGAFSYLDMFDAATKREMLREIGPVAHDLVGLMEREPVLLAALRAHLGDDGFRNWLGHEAFAASPYVEHGARWVWVAHIPGLPIHSGA